MDFVTVFVALICAIMVRFILFIKKSIEIMTQFDSVPGPRPRLPILGNVLLFHKKNVPTSKLLHVVLKEVYQNHKEDGMALLYFGNRVMLYLFKPEHISRFINDATVMDKANEYDVFKVWLGDGLVTANGQKWKAKRKLLNPTFHSKILECYVPAINDQSVKLVEKIRASMSEKFIDIRSMMCESTLNVIAKTAMGVDLNSESKDYAEYRRCLHSVPTILISRMYNPLNWNDFIFYKRQIGKQLKREIEVLHTFTRNVVKQRKETFITDINYNDTKEKAFLDLLLTLQKQNPSITDEDIREDVDTFMLAGHDTSSSCLIFTLLLLGKYTNAQKKVIQEIESIFGDDKQRDVNFDDINRMVYTEMCVKESLRLYPPGPVFGRVASNEFEVDGHKFPKGTNLIFLLREAHRDENVFRNANEFIPERFADENNNHFAFLPFAAGPRNCIGQRFAMIEIKMILSHIFRNFTINFIGKEEDIEFSIDATMRAITPINVSFTPIVE